jgi:hypothetical protein
MNKFFYPYEQYGGSLSVVIRARRYSDVPVHSWQMLHILVFPINIILLNECRGLFLPRKSGNGVKPTAHFRLVPGLKIMNYIYFRLVVCVHGAVLNKVQG